MGVDAFEITITIVKMLIIFLMMVQAVPILVWLERRGSAFIQNRFGPNRVGPLGLVQLLADAVKFLFKEEFLPKKAIPFMYYAAPVFALLPATLALMAIPLSFPIHLETFDLLGKTWGPYNLVFQGYYINVGIVFVLGVSSLAVYSILLAGFGSGNKFSLLGALRASAQIISYELALGLSIVGIIMLYGTFDFASMISQQQGSLSFNFLGHTIASEYLPNWGVFYQPLGAIIFFASLFAESNRLPFDLAEGEAELVAGFHVEYGGFKMLLFFIGEYGHMIVGSALFITFFLGGYTSIIPSWNYEFIHGFITSHVTTGNLASVLTSLVFHVFFMLKLAILLWIFIWVRWTLPRFRYDQLMDLGWKTMLPWALGNTIFTAIMIFIANS